MERIAERITVKLINNKVIEKESKAFYQYGLQLGLELGLNILISIIIAVALKMELEAILFLALFQLLRSSAGGFHLKSYVACTFFSSVLLWCILYLTKNYELRYGFMAILTLASLILVIVLGPVEDLNRPISIDERKKFKRKLVITAFCIICAFAIFAVSRCTKVLMVIMLTCLSMFIVLLLGQIRLCIHNRK